MNSYLEAIKELESQGLVFNQMMIKDMSDLTWGQQHRTLGCEEHFECHTKQPGWEYNYYMTFGSSCFIPTKEQYMEMLTRPIKEGENWIWSFGCENQGCATFFAIYKTAEDDPVIEYRLEDTREDLALLIKYENWQEFKDAYKIVDDVSNEEDKDE